MIFLNMHYSLVGLDISAGQDQGERFSMFPGGKLPV